MQGDDSKEHLKSESDSPVDVSAEILKKRKCDRRHKRMSTTPLDAGVPGWVLNLRVMFEERYWNYLNLKTMPNADDAGKKRLADCREKLEKCAKEYLELVPQQIRFYDTKLIYEILFDVAKQDPECSGLEVMCHDFKTMEEFSTHLMKFPGKFKNIHFGIKGYITFDSSDKVWLENIDGFGFESLELGQRLIAYLGFLPTNQTEGSKLFLEGPLDPFWVNEFARDCINAIEECKITSSIRKTVADKFPCTWEDVMRFRFRYSGTAEQAARELILLKTNQKYLSNAAFLESYINKKECEKEKIVHQNHQLRKEITGEKKKYEEMARKFEDLSRKFNNE